MLTINERQYYEILNESRIYDVVIPRRLVEAAALFTTPTSCITLRGAVERAACRSIELGKDNSLIMRDLYKSTQG